ncbi:MAG: hypothetical protein ACR2PX_08955 [Endozoicomonas sp.]|uniref:hypothetical protein n=1 Tax=Endozoicomonas sp. TaxID=1892382 RepID=UPI003D9B82D8
MAFLDHIDPGNSGGSVPTPASPFEKRPLKPVEYLCPVCEQSFSLLELMRDHRAKSHPLKRPYFLIDGKACSQEMVLYKPLSPESVIFEDTKSARLDGVEYESTDALKKQLLAQQVGRRRLELFYQAYSVTVDLVFNIIPETELQAVEECFYSIFDSDELSADHLKRFYCSIKANGLDGNVYAGGLGCYLTAVLVKDRSPEVALSYERFLEKFGEAEDKLANIDRALAQAILLAMQFNRNVFGEPGSLVRAPALQSAVSCLQSGRFKDVHQSAETWSRFPTDVITELLVAFCTQGESYRREVVEELEQQLRQNRVSGYDSAKLAFVLMVYFYEVEDFHKAEQVFRAVKFDPVLGTRAAELMDSDK